MGRRSPGGRGRLGRKPTVFRGPTAEDRRRGGGEGISGLVDDGFREAGGDGESRGAEHGGRGGRRQSGRMTVAAEEEDTTTTMVADLGRKSGQVLEGEGRCFYI
jgi:hypothetical protein